MSALSTKNPCVSSFFHDKIYKSTGANRAGNDKEAIMDRKGSTYATYIEILRKELVPAMGCTEPIAVAYCAAIARRILGSEPESVEIEASGNIIKNVKSVIVPNTDGRRGVEAAAAVGIIAGDDTLGLELISNVSAEDKARLSRFLAETPIKVRPAASELALDVTVSVYSGGDSVKVLSLIHISEPTRPY